MNYDKIIIELLSRTQALEEKVDMLMKEKSKENATQTADELVGVTSRNKTKELRDYIENQKNIAKNNGKKYIILRANDIHRNNHLKNRIPLVCNAMRQCMGDGDVVLHETPSGCSSSLEIKYFL